MLIGLFLVKLWEKLRYLMVKLSARGCHSIHQRHLYIVMMQN